MRRLTLAPFLLAPSLLAAVAQRPQATQVARPPNVVILYADDMGFGDLGANAPASKIPTPHLDRLASEGIRFTDAHSSSGVCTPSRYALLTGRHHWRQFHGIVDAFGPSVLPAERLTLAEMLRARGYQTACIGKWHLGWNWKAIMKPGAQPTRIDGKPRGYAPDAFDWSKPIPDGPCAHGFDSYFGDDVPNFPPYAWIENDRVVEAPTIGYSPSPAPAEGNHEGRPGPMVAGWQLDAVMPTLTTRAVEWIEARGRERRAAQARDSQARPFFLYFPFTSPHAPIVPSKEFRGSTEVGGYGDYVAETDATVGAVLAALERGGFADDTLVVFTSDNGPEHYAFERVRRTGHRSMGPLRGVKRDTFEGGHRVPFLVRWPGVTPPGAVSDALIGQMDLMATLATVVGATLPDDAAEDSFDLLPLLRGETKPVREFIVHNTNARRYAIRKGDWLLIDSETGSETKMPEWFATAEGYPEGGGEGMLFDLRADLGQRVDRYAEQPERVAELRASLARVREQGHSAPRLRGR